MKRFDWIIAAALAILLLLALVLAASADADDDRKAPELPRRLPEYIHLRIGGSDLKTPLHRFVARKYGWRDGQRVSVEKLFEAKDAESEYLRQRLR
jgi:hypothetical protein